MEALPLIQGMEALPKLAQGRRGGQRPVDLTRMRGNLGPVCAVIICWKHEGKLTHWTTAFALAVVAAGCSKENAPAATDSAKVGELQKQVANLRKELQEAKRETINRVWR